VTAITMPVPFDPIAEVKAILASIDTMLGGTTVPQASVPQAQPKPKAPKGKSRTLGFTKVTWRKTGSGFMEPVFTSPKTVESTKIDSLATYHKRLMAMGCEPVGTDDATGATVYRTPEGTELKVRAAGQGKSLESPAMREGATRARLGEALASAKRAYAHAKRIKGGDSNAEYLLMVEAQGVYDRFNADCGVES